MHGHRNIKLVLLISPETLSSRELEDNLRAQRVTKLTKAFGQIPRINKKYCGGGGSYFVTSILFQHCFEISSYNR
jgi:hypothetical protein